MGKPKFSRKKYETPSHPWQEDRIKEENELIKKYGLKNKREIWKAQTRLGRYRTQARELLASVATGDVQSKKESEQLLLHLNRMNILPAKSTLDDVLALDIESILSRRLQTLTYLKGLANTPTQARQLISHGHIAISERRVTVPGYMVSTNEEGELGYTHDSPLNDGMHPARPRADFKSSIKKEEKPKIPKEEKTTEPEKKETEKPETTVEKEDKPPAEEKRPVEEKPSEETKKQEEKPSEETKEEPAKKPDEKQDKPEKKSSEEKKEKGEK
jgi:small subunit ribosomal protein S4